MKPDFISEFILDSKYIRLIRLRYSAVVILLWLLIGILDAVSKGGWQINGRNASPLMNFWLSSASILILGGITIIISYKNIGNRFNGFKIMLNEEMIAKTNSKNAVVYLEFSQISYAAKNYSGNLFLYNHKGKALIIPRHIAGFDKLEDIIRGKVQIFIDGPYSFYQKQPLIILSIFIALFLTIFALQNKLAIVMLGAFLICGVVVVFERSYREIKSRGIKLDRNPFVWLLVSIAIIILSVVQKLLEK